MKKLLEYYATAVIAAIVALGMMATFYHLKIYQTKGVAAAMGSVLETVLEKPEWKVKTGKELVDYARHRPPEIFIRNINALKVGEEIMVSNLFTARDEAGNYLPVEVIECWDENGEVAEGMSTDKHSLYISNAGTYWLRASAIDSSGFTKEIIVEVYVNER